MDTTQRAYINGFVKRAAYYGHNEREAFGILKYANTSPQIQPNMMRSSAAAINNKDHTYVPGMSEAPKINIPQNPMQANTQRITNSAKQYPAGQNTVPVAMPSKASVMSEFPRELANIPLSGMTPKNQWETQLHDMMAKKPVFNIGWNRNNFQTFSNNLGEAFYGKQAPDPLEMAADHMETLLTALKGNNLQVEKLYHYEDEPQNGETPKPIKMPYLAPGVKANDPRVIRIQHIDEIKKHLDKYNPTWGPDFRLPVEKHDIPGEDSDLYDRATALQNKQNEFKSLFTGHINNANNPTANLTTNLQ